MRTHFLSRILLIAFMSSEASAFEVAGIEIGSTLGSIQDEHHLWDDGKNRLYLSTADSLLKVKANDERQVIQVKYTESHLGENIFEVIEDYNRQYPMQACIDKQSESYANLQAQGYGKVQCQIKDEMSTLTIIFSSYAGQVTTSLVLKEY